MIRRIDSAALLRRFHAACVRAGVDPVAGATTYQAANAAAEARKAAARQRVTTWWQRVDWFDWFHEGGAHSETEHDAILHLALEAFRAAYVPPPRHANHDAPLRDVLTRRGATLIYIPVDDHLVAVEAIAERIPDV